MVSTVEGFHCSTYSMFVPLYCTLCFRRTFFPSAVVTIGFNPVTYSVLEDAGSVNVTVSILNGTLARNVVVTLLVSGGTATGKI